MLNWKHSFERLSKHKKWEEDYLNRHAQCSRCKADEEQRSLYNWFKPTEVVEEEEEYDLDVNEDQNQEFLFIETLNRTPAQFGGSRHIEVVVCEIFPNLFSKSFSRKKLNSKQKRQLNRILFTESVWKIDRASNAVRAKNCTGISGNGNVCFECSKNLWVALADKALKGAFNNTPVFTGLCEVMVQELWTCSNKIWKAEQSNQFDKLTLDKLRLWSNDKQISEIIHHSHHLACDLAEYVGMIQSSNISIDINASRIFIESHEIEISSFGINKQSHDNNNEEYDLTSAIKESSNNFIEGCSQLDEIAQPSDNLFTLNGGDSDNQKNIAIALAQLHVQELAKSRKSKKLNKKNVQENLIEIPNIETANITEEFPLSKEDYVFVRYRPQMCIRRVEALYFKAYNHHCYTDKPIKDLNDISYISLHVFVPLHLDLFTDIVKE
ncbi:10139_t:CDS:10, partial [Funneliformis geosporum]